MASKASRWANDKEDAEAEARLKHEKEEKRRKKAEKTRRLELEQQEASRRLATADDPDKDDRPSKRRKLTPEPSRDAVPEPAPRKLLRFETTGWDRSRSVDDYDKLNDIEEGTYGWVARAAHRSTGKVVALKRLKLDANDRNGLPVTGLREIQILHDCQHRNIVGLDEVVTGGDTSRLDK